MSRHEQLKKKNNVIGIDARFYGPVGKGLGRYTQEIVDRVIRKDTENDYVIFLYKDNYDSFVVPRQGVKKVLANARWYTLKEQIMLPFLIWREHVSLMHFTHFNVPILTPVKFVVTIPDLILTKYPTQRASTLSPWLYKLKNLFYKIVIWTAVKRAKKIIAVSKYTEEDIIKQFKVKPKKIVMIYEGTTFPSPPVQYLSSSSLRSDTPLLIRRGDGGEGGKRFILYVGNAYPHKNLEMLIKILPKLRERFSDLKLVLVGKEDYFYKRVKDYARGLRLFKDDEDSPVNFPGFVPDEDLKFLFQNASAYVFPSLYEGFGLPPLEAMSQGCPVVSSDRSCLPEVLSEAAIYFDPENEDDMIKKIKLIIKDENLRQNLIQKGFEQIKKYSWDKAAEETVAVYKNMLK
ncbi:MAG: glycosyltransferase family 1 protein [Patescibacteria group bacterium]|nr:glycosyltransferase family 1 protein [Patescibacteria group bacterium]MDD4611109.1 glycosyltransferase family 1 protein [Patescibacteria group bacterium]